MLPSCNPWGANTARFSDQLAACKENSAQAENYALLPERFLLLVIDSLERLAQAGVAGFQPLTAYEACDGVANAKNAQCAFQNLTPPFQFNSDEMQQIVEWQLGNALCG